MNILPNQKSAPAVALSLFFLSAICSPQSSAQEIDKGRAVFVKVVLRGEGTGEGDQPPVESWIARKLQKHGAEKLHAATGWIRLSENAEKSVAIWNGAVDEKGGVCPVDGYVSKSADGERVQVTLSGWGPFPPEIKGNSLPLGIGSRGIAVVDPGRADGVKSYVAMMIAPVSQARNPK